MNTTSISSNKEARLDNSLSNFNNLSSEDRAKFYSEPTTPYSNTGVAVSSDPYSVSIGWITFSCVVDDSADLSSALCCVRSVYTKNLMDEFSSSNLSFRGYKCSEASYLGATLAWTPGRTDFCLTLPQTLCDQVTTEYLLWLIAEMLSAGCRVTRLDLTIDDYLRRLNIDDVYQACVDGHLVARTAEVDPSKPINVKTGEVREHKLTIGRRVSEFFLRIYDKAIESKGKINSIRVEQELKGSLAQRVAKLLIDSAFSGGNGQISLSNFSFTRFCDTVISVLVTKVDFRDKASNNNITRRKRLEFWDSFVLGVSKTKIEVIRKVNKIERVIDWVADSVSASLATLQAYFGSGFRAYLKGVLDIGQAKMRNRHYKLLITNSNSLSNVPCLT